MEEQLRPVGDVAMNDAAKPREFIAVYERLVPEMTSILEIGVYKGGSLDLWRKLAPDARILGLDHASWQNQSAEEVVEGEQFDSTTLAMLIERGPWDLVIDDGSHIWEHQQASFAALWPHAGTYVIEDLITSYRPDSEWAKGQNTMAWLKERLDTLMDGAGSMCFYAPGMVVIQ
jgi:hypothetical protein